MEYKGNLFGKVGKHYFPLEKTTEYVEKIEEQNKKMNEVLIKIINNIEKHGISIYNNDGGNITENYYSTLKKITINYEPTR